jgi:hypothetical protein
MPWTKALLTLLHLFVRNNSSPALIDAAPCLACRDYAIVAWVVM